MEKRIWIERRFGDQFNRKLIVTHQKSMIAADILIDDRESEQTKSFKGTWYWFGKDGADWKAVLNSIEHNFK
jgi:5'-nucleotidase